MIIVRQKQFDEEESSTGSKILKGTLGVAGTVGAFYGARKGMLGNTIQMGANKLYGQAGVQLQRLGNTVAGGWKGGGNFLAKRGNNMVESASKEYGIANAQKNLIKEGMSKDQVVGAINKGKSQLRNDLYKDYGGRSGFRTQQNNIDYKNMYDSQKAISKPTTNSESVYNYNNSITTASNSVPTVDQLKGGLRLA